MESPFLLLKASGEVPVMGPGEADRILAAVTGERASGARCGHPTVDGTPCERIPAPGASRCHLHQSKKGTKKVKTTAKMSTKQALKVLRKAARVAPDGSLERARCEQLRTFLVLRSTYAPLTKAIPPDQAQAIHLAVADAQAAGVPGSATGTRVTSGPSGAEDQLRGIVAGTGAHASLAGTASPAGVAPYQSPASSLGVIKTAEAAFAQARELGSAEEIARAGEALTLARLRRLHESGR